MEVRGKNANYALKVSNNVRICNLRTQPNQLSKKTGAADLDDPDLLVFI
jgi:hypothetical protein